MGKKVFATKAENEVSWFQTYPKTSMEFLELFNLSLDANIIDVGGGDSHFVDALLEKGDKIKQGDVIGLSGNTGKSTGPHLHLTLTDPSGAKVDPQKMLYSEVV